MEDVLSYVCFCRYVSIKQEIVDTSTGEILFSIERSLIKLNVNYFHLILIRFIKLLREHRTHLQLRIHVFTNVEGTNQLPFSS